MLLSEKLKQDHECGDFGKALEGYSELAFKLEVQAFCTKWGIMKLIKKYKEEREGGNGRGEACREYERELMGLLNSLGG